MRIVASINTKRVRMQIVRLLGFKDAHVVGHSFGSFVASMLCQVYPEMVKSLVRRDLERRVRLVMLAITLAAGLVIAVVLYFAGAFRRSTG